MGVASGCSSAGPRLVEIREGFFYPQSGPFTEHFTTTITIIIVHNIQVDGNLLHCYILWNN